MINLNLNLTSINFFEWPRVEKNSAEVRSPFQSSKWLYPIIFYKISICQHVTSGILFSQIRKPTPQTSSIQFSKSSPGLGPSYESPSGYLETHKYLFYTYSHRLCSSECAKLFQHL